MIPITEADKTADALNAAALERIEQAVDAAIKREWRVGDSVIRVPIEPNTPPVVFERIAAEYRAVGWQVTVDRTDAEYNTADLHLVLSRPGGPGSPDPAPPAPTQV